MAFILAGGRSSRMGTDKAFLKLGNQTLLQRAITTVESASSHFAIVGDRLKFSACGKIVEDIHRGCGPLAAIHSALLHSTAELNLILAVDLPFVTTGVLGFLFGSAENSDALVTVPRTAAGFQPLCAIYRRAFAAAADQALRAGKYKIDALFGSIRVRVIEEPELRTAGFSEKLFANLNTREELEAARSEISP